MGLLNWLSRTPKAVREEIKKNEELLRSDEHALKVAAQKAKILRKQAKERGVKVKKKTDLTDQGNIEKVEAQMAASFRAIKMDTLESMTVNMRTAVRKLREFSDYKESEFKRFESLVHHHDAEIERFGETTRVRITIEKQFNAAEKARKEWRKTRINKMSELKKIFNEETRLETLMNANLAEIKASLERIKRICADLNTVGEKVKEQSDFIQAELPLISQSERSSNKFIDRYLALINDRTLPAIIEVSKADIIETKVAQNTVQKIKMQQHNWTKMAANK